jgi:glycosyltransferase involved in cell wall biosynthesis
MKPLRVCLDARLVSGITGGVEQAIIGLATGLSKLDDGNEEYVFLTYPDSQDWIRPYLDGRCRILSLSPSSRHSRKWKHYLGPAFPYIRQLWQDARPLLGKWAIRIPHSDGTIERANVDLMHFTTQGGFITQVPSIYHPWDLQHLHFPALFTPYVRLHREIHYRALCQQAKIVVMATSWGKQDISKHYRLPEEKVQVVPCAPTLNAYPDPQDRDLMFTRQKYVLPEHFIFYPAQTWPHKNHIGLLRALAILRDRGVIVPLVASGHLNDFYPTIQRSVRELRLDDQVKFLGFVSPLELQSLFRLCRAMIFPSRFEGWGLPLTDAFAAGAPVACSNATSIPELVGDAAIIFDPDQPDEIASAIYRLWQEESLRRALIERGKKRAAIFSWDRIARIFRAYYRQIAEHPLTDEDRALLTASPLV